MKMILAAAALVLSAASAHAGPDLTAGIGGAFEAKAKLQALTARAAPTAAPDAETLAKASVTGSFVYTFTITIASTIPSATPIECNTIVAHGGLAGAAYVESADATAKRSGSKATCTMTIPYLWALADPKGFVLPQITVVAGTRQLSHPLPPFTLPATGKTTSVTQALKF